MALLREFASVKLQGEGFRYLGTNNSIKNKDSVVKKSQQSGELVSFGCNRRHIEE